MKLIVDNMSCNHCAKAVTKAITELDADAKVTVDLAKKEVIIENATLSKQDVINAIDDAGYPVIEVIE